MGYCKIKFYPLNEYMCIPSNLVDLADILQMRITSQKHNLINSDLKIVSGFLKLALVYLSIISLTINNSYASLANYMVMLIR